MPAQDTKPTKDKIMEVLNKRGPSLPVHIAKETGLSMLFASAFLAELLSSKKIRIGHLKVGGSPIYMIPGHESKLESFSQYLKSKERDAFMLLKEKKFLEDSQQDPAIRVALREIKDFAMAFQTEGKVIWRYFIIPESQYINPTKPIEPKEEAPKPTPQNPEKQVEQNHPNKVEHDNNPQPHQNQNNNSSQENNSHQNNAPSQNNNSSQNNASSQENNSLQEGTQNQSDKEKPKELDIFDDKEKSEEPEFIPNVLRYIEKSEIKLIEETETKKREFLGIGRVDSPLGEMEILIMGKDKKKINEKDLEKILEKAKESNRIALLFSNGEIDNKAKEYYRKIKNLIYFKNIE